MGQRDEGEEEDRPRMEHTFHGAYHQWSKNASHTLDTYTRVYSTLCIECYNIAYFTVHLAYLVYTVVYYNMLAVVSD